MISGKLALTTFGIKAYVSVTSPDLNDSGWHFVAAVLDEEFNTTFYVDGVQYDTIAHGTDMNPSSCNGDIGGVRASATYPAVSPTFNGTIDELKIFNSSLSAEQILALYNNRTDLLVSNETSVGDVWKACVTPNDGLADGTVSCSSTLTVLETPSVENNLPVVTNVTLNSSLGTNYSSENLTVYWNISDADGDNVTNITNWYLNGTSITVLNMPFENWGSNSTHNASNLTLDYSNFSNNPNFVGPTWSSTAGYNGWGAYEFDGLDDWINISSSDSLNITGELTAEAWIYPKSLTCGVNADCAIFGRYDSDVGKRGWLAWIDDGGSCNGDEIIFWVSSTGATFNGIGICSNVSVQVNKWYHVAVRFKPNSYAEIFINGTNHTGSVSTGSVPGSIFGGDNPTAIGVFHPSNPSRLFNGTIDDVRIYNRSLSPEQILAHYNNRTDLLVSQETDVGDVWSSCIVPNDGTEDGAENCSNTLSVKSLIPSAFDVVLNSTDGTNLTSENLTVYWNVSDPEGDTVTNVTNWYMNDTSIIVLNMPFEADGGLNATDHSGYGNNATVLAGSPIWHPTGGRDGFGAFEFNHSDGTDYVYIPGNTISLKTTYNISVELWLYIEKRPGDMAATYPGLINKQNWTPRKGWSLGFNNPAVSDDKMLWRVLDDSTSHDLTYNSASDLTLNKWHHIVATYDENYQRIYIDGAEKASRAETNPIVYDDYRIVIGAAMEGFMDDVRIYNRTLTPEQIQLLFDNRTDMISFNETNLGDVWKACVTPNDGTSNGVENCSNTLTITLAPNELPVAENITLNSTYSTNYTTENLTVYWDVRDADGDNITNVTNWYLNGTSISVLNMPFEATGGNESNWIRDYSNFSNHGNVSGATWNRTGGHGGWGAYEFDGLTDHIKLPELTEIETPDYTVSYWFKTGSTARMQPFAAIDYDIPANYAYAVSALNSYWDGQVEINSLRCGLRDDVGTAVNAYYNATADGITIYDNSWHLFTCVFDDANDNIHIYLDGVLRNTTSGSFGDRTEADTYTLGALRYSGNDPALNFNGTIDDVIIYNRSLSAEQILALYNNRTDMLVSQETSVDDVWKACVTPNDGTEDGLENCSSALTVLHLVEYNLSCNITTVCDYTDVFHISNDINGHAELPNQSYYSDKVCCKEIGDADLDSNCSAANAFEVLRLEAQTNAHVEKVSENNYPFSACMNTSSDYEIVCSYESDCVSAGYDACLASISSTETGYDTNLQVSNCTEYATKVCCKAQETQADAPIIQSVSLNGTDHPWNLTNANLTA
ncbi:MAG: LamG-like jellyroll fold domain-containing protein, partial [Candidatus Thorarchaeota archaeon]